MHSPDSDYRALQEGVAVGKLHNFQFLFSIPFPQLLPGPVSTQTLHTCEGANTSLMLNDAGKKGFTQKRPKSSPLTDTFQKTERKTIPFRPFFQLCPQWCCLDPQDMYLFVPFYHSDSLPRLMIISLTFLPAMGIWTAKKSKGEGRLGRR